MGRGLNRINVDSRARHGGRKGRCKAVSDSSGGSGSGGGLSGGRCYIGHVEEKLVHLGAWIDRKHHPLFAVRKIVGLSTEKPLRFGCIHRESDSNVVGISRVVLVEACVEPLTRHTWLIQA